VFTTAVRLYGNMLIFISYLY